MYNWAISTGGRTGGGLQGLQGLFIDPSQLDGRFRLASVTAQVSSNRLVRNIFMSLGRARCFEGFDSGSSPMIAAADNVHLVTGVPVVSRD